ncbi:MAG: hypothetical protein KIT09_17415 [Bryobacteraceae bacterium]|nr:hypothetical protein [Bryobacteraceae bacterium]
MPVLRADAGTRALFVQCGPPAEHVRIRGLIFDSSTSGAQVLTLGCVGASLFGRTASADGDQPDDIIVEHCIFRNPDWNVNQQAAYIGAFTRGALVRNNWIAGGRWPGVEVQAILIMNGPGPVDVLNNYLGDTGGETIMHGGVGPNWDVSPSGSMILNAFYNHPERMLGLNSLNPVWQSNTAVFKGRYVKHSNGWFKATTSGTTGSSQPDFPTSGSVNDNGVTWTRVAASSASSQIILKNLYETKNSRNVTNAWNQYRGYTNQAQVQAIVYKLSNSPPNTSSNQRCVPFMTGKVNTNGVTVTSADGNPIPNNHLPLTMNNVDPRKITIGSTSYTIGDFVWDNDYTLQLTTSAGVQSNVTYSYGWSNCFASSDRDNKFMYNIVEQSSMGVEVVQFDNGMQWRIGNLLVKNNLFREIDCQVWGGCGGLGVRGFNWFAYAVPGVMFENNTIVDSQNAPTTGLLLSNPNNVTGRGLRRIRGNIWPKSSGVGLSGIDPTTSEGNNTLTTHLCYGQSCTSNEWGFNVIAGVNKGNYTQGGPVYNLCSTSAACNVDFDFNDPTHGKLFQNKSLGILKPRTDHFAFRGGPEGEAIGVDYQMLPLIRKPTGGEGPVISATNNSALFSYWAHSPLVAYDLACSLEVSTTRDIDNLISMSDPNRLTDIFDGYPRPGNRRNIVITGLSAGTTYWYRLHCGPIYEGSFTTASAASSSKSVSVGFTARETSQFRIAYGASYSRTSDSIQSPSFGGWVSCAVNQSCQVSATIPPGIAYYRVESLSGNKKPVQVRPI